MTYEITCKELSAIMRSAEVIQLIDVRELDENAAFNIGGDCLPLPSLPESAEKLDKDLLTVLYCRLGNRSAKARDLLLEAGFKKVKSLAGGVMAWQRKDADTSDPG